MLTRSFNKIRPFIGKARRRLFGRANITSPTGSLSIDGAEKTFVMVVGPSFDQNRPDAMMKCRIGYCRAFELLGVPYRIVDVREAADVVKDLANPFCMYFAGDLDLLSEKDAAYLSTKPCAVWVYPWFEKSDEFFSKYNLDPEPWFLANYTKRVIEALQPAVCFTATTQSGLSFFAEWERRGIRVVSYPLACDTTIYDPKFKCEHDFSSVQLAFVGGYWTSKGKQLDEYLRSFEDKLTIYGYSAWPYRGYAGLIAEEWESCLYRQASICPVINEPTVALLRGQINERVFKILGSGGLPITDAVPAYKELFGEGELLVSENIAHFREMINFYLNNPDASDGLRQRGRKAVLERHTYLHRAENLLRDLHC